MLRFVSVFIAVIILIPEMSLFMSYDYYGKYSIVHY